ncbi:MAG TPA: enoyl-CoA hydratase-related protein [Kineosporiaceae bacterium]
MAITPTDTLTYDVRDSVAYVMMNRPKSMNALNRELQRAIAEAFEQADADPGVLAVVLGGEGGRAFCAGGDLKDVASRIESGESITGGASKTVKAHPKVAKPGTLPGMDQVNACSKPTIAAIDGYAMGGGLELALYCDIRLATRQSQFALPEPKRHLLSGPAFVHLSRMIPLGEAMYMELTGRRLDAERAFKFGLVQEVYDTRDDLNKGVEAVLAEIRENSPLAVQFLKRVIKDGRDMTVEQHWKFAEMFAYTLENTEDALEGPKAFAEKRKPEWKMR